MEDQKGYKQQCYTIDCNANRSISPVWYTFQNYSHINQYLIPTTRRINQTILWGVQTKKSQPKYYHSKSVDISSFMLITFACQNAELLDLNTFLDIPEHQQVLIIELRFWKKQII